jgi:ABC-type hemin transport system ATPase subunit
VICSLHQVELALGWAHRIVGLRDGEKVLDRDARTLDSEDVMHVYRRVAPATAAVGPRHRAPLDEQMAGPDALCQARRPGVRVEAGRRTER